MPFIEHEGRRILFIHIPRTGGTSVEKWLETHAPLNFRTVGLPGPSKVTPQHYRFDDFKALFRPGYFDYVFAIVRNPYDRLASEYRLRAAQSRGGPWKESMLFPIWLETNLTTYAQNIHHHDNHLRPQVHFLGDEVRLFRFEDGLQNVRDTVAAETGINAGGELGHHLGTGTGDEIVWDVAQRARVQELYAQDFKMLGYPEDPPGTPVAGVADDKAASV